MMLYSLYSAVATLRLPLRESDTCTLTYACLSEEGDGAEVGLGAENAEDGVLELAVIFEE